MSGKYMKNQWVIIEKIGLFLYIKEASEMALSSPNNGLHQSKLIDNLEKPDWAYECGWCLIERPISTTGLSLIGLLCFNDAMSYRKKISKEEREKIYNKYGGMCGYCGADLEDKMHIDHATPISKGGSSDFYNYMPACPSCNTMKSNLTVEGFRKSLSEKHMILLKKEPKYRVLLRLGLIEYHDSEILFYFEKIRGVF